MRAKIFSDIGENHKYVYQFDVVAKRQTMRSFQKLNVRIFQCKTSHFCVSVIQSGAISAGPYNNTHSFDIRPKMTGKLL